jgi:hypothetical protein
MCSGDGVDLPRLKPFHDTGEGPVSLRVSVTPPTVSLAYFIRHFAKSVGLRLERSLSKKDNGLQPAHPYMNGADYTVIPKMRQESFL